MSTTKKQIRTRFAPSPTGFLHIGSLRTALYAYALAKHDKGDFILRIEDTDQKREVKGSRDALKNTLKLFGLSWDEYYVQSERHKTNLYKKKAEKLVKEGHAFYCQCDARNAKESGYSLELRDPCRDKGYKKGAIKLKVPDDKNLEYFDFVHDKKISWKSDGVYDATLLKSDGYPTYHLAAMVDDMEMKVSHILRGHDWLPSTPIHLLVFKYLGGDRPEIGHLTDILSAQTGKKLSKRRDSVFVEDFLSKGYLPEALLNFIMLLGWAPKDNREIYTLSEFVENFDEKGFGDANPRFLTDKLDWMNGQYIQKLDDNDLMMRIVNLFGKKYATDDLKEIAPLVKTRMKTLSEFEELAGFFFKEPKADMKLFGPDYKEHLDLAINVFENTDKWDIKEVNDLLMKEIEKNDFKVGKFFMDVRIAITGKKFTPPINESIIILGKENTLSRLRKVK